MAKRKFNGEAPLSGKKAKLHHQVNPDEQISDTHAHDSLPASLASPERREKRKRTIELESDTHEAVETKRARKDSIKSLDPDPEQNLDFVPWPSVRDVPRKEESNWVQRYYERAYRGYLLSEKAYDESYNEDNMPADEPNPLPSPGPSDGEAAEGDEREFPTASPERAQHPRPPVLEQISRPELSSVTLWPGVEYFPTIAKPTRVQQGFPTASPEQAQHPIPILEQDSDSEQGSDSEQDSRPEQNPRPELSSNTVWPSVRDVPRKEESNWVQRYYERAYRGYLLSEKAYDESYNEDNMPTDEPNQSTNSEARHSTINPYRIYSPPPLRKRDTIPSQRKWRQPLEEGKKKRKKNKPQGEALSPAAKAFLRSKRSSRRDPNGNLWHLGNDGIACKVSRVR
ncbi:hypothetical protein HDV63DRAFT_183447 [Trichoderma sp. SZMC 28014]